MLTNRIHAFVAGLAAHRSALIAIAVAVALVLWVVRQILCTGPYRLPRVLPWRVSRRPVLMWRTGPFLGWSRGVFGQTRWAFGSREDTVAIVGPPRVSGKTAGIVIPQAAMFDGALVTTSTKPDVLRHTAARRLELARHHGGDVYVYAPTATGPIEGFQPVRWSPLAGCEDPSSPRCASTRSSLSRRSARTSRTPTTGERVPPGSCGPTSWRPRTTAASREISP